MVVTLGNVKLTEAGEIDISEVAARKQLGVYDKFPPPLSPPKVLGGLGDSASDGSATAGGDGDTAGSDNSAASGNNSAAGGDNGVSRISYSRVRLQFFVRSLKPTLDQLWYQVDPKRTGIDWRINKDPKVSSVTNSSAANKCTLCPVGELANNPDNPDNILLKAPNIVLYTNGQPYTDKSKAKKGKGKAVGSGKASTRPVAASPAIDKGKGKARAVPTTPTKASGAYTTSSKSKKKRAAIDAPGSKDKDSKKKKRSKDTPNPPYRKDATPRSGPSFDSRIYTTPLD
ncbi:hypothetical protein PENNAL_c0537G10165 [Penicillium nalgiovense]|uniref:Uncharacterized protein n=1 Tax=Penicillium nalgiovense TaxID=60175 RepID=A0A1V6VGE8_PENNA|nr:hypothetical protein PENNAL_c0537G10165 [Penicillium nalgiovense]